MIKKKLTKEQFIELARKRGDAVIKKAQAEFDRAADIEYRRHEARMTALRVKMEAARKKARRIQDDLEADWWNGLTDAEREAEMATWKRRV